ncbi:hypothetical protein J437_LFUL010767 [Ladona fulva]|uniref:FYVE-type domain-containing protein n=1 Tax=Ladona fulva TaxID=123851 RepID=A0A8K0P016_LADFU|nr:hypothetical protein J437_LFUL010767 [Ladona fulva]
MEETSPENEDHCQQNEISSDGLDSKVKEVMETIRKLEAEKQQAQEEFGQQRARLKELYMKKEEELMRESQERVRLQELTDRLQHELNETKSQLLLTSFRLESDVAQEKRKRQEEVASLEKLMQEAVEEANLSQKKFKEEIRRLQKMNERLDSELNEAHRPAGDSGSRLPLQGAVAALAPGASIISAYTKSIARKVGSLGPGLTTSTPTSAQVTSPSNASSAGIFSSNAHPNVGESSAVVSSLTSSEENLEEGMRKAQEDAEVLRSLVIPLEEEIEALKDKLRNAYHILKSYGYEDGKDYVSKESEDFQPLKNKEQSVLDNVANEVEGLSREDGSAEFGLLTNGSPNVKHSQDNQGVNSSVLEEDSLNKSESHPEDISTSDQIPDSSSSEIWPQQTQVYRNNFYYIYVLELKTQMEASEKALQDMRATFSKVCKDVRMNHEKLLHEREEVGRELVSNSEVSSLQNVCHMCENYEAQLQKMQEEVREMEKKIKVSERAAERYREDLLKETEFRKDMEEKWNEKKEQHKNQAAVQIFIASYVLFRLQNENDKLVGKHSAHSQELQNETINLPNKVEELQELLLKFREEVIAAKVGKEAAEETEKTFQEECLNLYEQIRIEQQKSAEFQITVQKQEQELMRLQGMESELKKQLAEVNKKLEEVSSVKKDSDTTVAELRNRVLGLHKELDVSVKVQQDLVQLSQSLQVQLEHIRESEKEVRWQHEDDFEDCAGCRSHFTPSLGKKHCNHCGRIFCPTCLSQTVTSGPNHRQYNVCKVCHTLLVREKPLFFSSEPTELPD